MMLPHHENVVIERKKGKMKVEPTSSPPPAITTTADSSSFLESTSYKTEKNEKKLKSTSKEKEKEEETELTPILFPVDLPDYSGTLENAQSSGKRKFAPSTLLNSSRNVLNHQWKKVKKAVISLKKQVGCTYVEQI